MTKVLATGVVSNLDFYKPEGKTYNLANMSVGGKSFKGLYKGTRGLVDGAMVEIIENPPAAGRTYGEKEVRLLVGSPVHNVAPASANPSQPARSGYGRDPAEQDRIMRQWAVTQGICIVNTAISTGAITKTAAGNEQILLQLIGKYANYFFNSVQTGAGFERMPQFTGEINEVSEKSEAGEQ